MGAQPFLGFLQPRTYLRAMITENQTHRNSKKSVVWLAYLPGDLLRHRSVACLSLGEGSASNRVFLDTELFRAASLAPFVSEQGKLDFGRWVGVCAGSRTCRGQTMIG